VGDGVDGDEGALRGAPYRARQQQEREREEDEGRRGEDSRHPERGRVAEGRRRRRRGRLGHERLAFGSVGTGTRGASPAEEAAAGEEDEGGGEEREVDGAEERALRARGEEDVPGNDLAELPVIPRLVLRYYFFIWFSFVPFSLFLILFFPASSLS
jgi:hypothetical protein